MRLAPIIAQLKAKAPSFGGRVAGAAQYKSLPDISNLQAFSDPGVEDSAYVVELDESAGPRLASNAYLQDVTETFAVIVVTSNLVDERGQAAVDRMHVLRAEVFKSILNWIMPGYDNPIVYAGKTLLGLNRYRADYQLLFSIVTTLDNTDGRDDDDPGVFDSLHIDLDHKTLPPDGVIDHQLEINHLND